MTPGVEPRGVRSIGPRGGAQPDPFDERPRGENVSPLGRPDSGGRGFNPPSKPSLPPRNLDQQQRFWQAPQRPPAADPRALQRLPQQWKPPQNYRPADPRDPSALRRVNPDPRALPPQRANSRGATPSDRSQPQSLTRQRPSPRPQPTLQPRSTQSPRGLYQWNGQGAPARTGQPPGGQRRR
jgi:hypothetical protein